MARRRRRYEDLERYGRRGPHIAGFGDVDAEHHMEAKLYADDSDKYADNSFVHARRGRCEQAMHYLDKAAARYGDAQAHAGAIVDPWMKKDAKPSLDTAASQLDKAQTTFINLCLIDKRRSGGKP